MGSAYKLEMPELKGYFNKNQFIHVRVLCLVAVVIINLIPRPVSANPRDNDPRTILTIEEVTEFEWWLVSWMDDQFACSLVIYHEGLPRNGEIENICGDVVYQRWMDNSVCAPAETGDDTSICPGLYLMLKGSNLVKREVIVTLPSPGISISLIGCVRFSLTNHCENKPYLRLNAMEPVQGQRITQIGTEIGGKEFFFSGNKATIPLNITGEKGELISFWADSTLGDSTKTMVAHFRVTVSNESSGYYVDILSSSWEGPGLPAYAVEWDSFPPLGEPAQWLSPANEDSALATDEPYLYLAGQLIRWGIADASICADGGLLINGYASQCGLDHSHEQIRSWQNRFDPKILQVANNTHIPAQLLKNVIAQETQFWPGYYDLSPNEFGLGRITEWGAEVVLMWDPDFYQTICLRIFSENSCAIGYSNQTETNQAFLRGSLISYVDASCASCPYQIDLNKAEIDIEVLGRSLLSSAAQVNQIIANLTEKSAGEVSSYEDLWRFTLANYNVGAGCMAESFEDSLHPNSILTWENVTSNLKGNCRNAIQYVDGVTRPRWESNPFANNVTTTVDP